MGRLVLGGLVCGALAFVALTWIYPAINGWRLVRIEGNSMAPELPYGAIAYVEAVDVPQVGDVVTFTAAGRIMTHRITHDVSGNGDLWRTQGDNAPAADAAYLRTDQILGRVVGHVPLLGLVTRVTSQPAFLGLLACLALIPLVRGRDSAAARGTRSLARR